MKPCIWSTQAPSFAVKCLVPVLSLAVGCGGSGASLKAESFDFVGEVSEIDLHKAYIDIQQGAVGQRAAKAWRSMTWTDFASSVGQAPKAASDIAFNIGSATILSKGMSAADYKSALGGFSKFKNVAQLMEAYKIRATDVTPESIARGARQVAAIGAQNDAALSRMNKLELEKVLHDQLVLLEAVGATEAMNKQQKLGFVWLIPLLFTGAIAARIAATGARVGSAIARAVPEEANAIARGAARVAGDRVGNGVGKGPDQVAMDAAEKICEKTCEPPKNPEDQPNIIGGAL